MTKVLINGAGGFIGSHMVRGFLDAGYDVRASDIPEANLAWAEKLGAETIPSRLEDKDSIDKAVKGVDMVVHNAAIFDLATPRKVIIDTNVEGTRYHCEAALKHGAGRFIQFSSVGVYGAPRRTPADEPTAKHPRNPYEESKHLSELLAMDYFAKHGLPAAAIRPTLVYGPGSKYGQAMYLLVTLMLRYWGRPRFITNAKAPWTHHVHVDDVVGGVLALAGADEKKVVGKAFNVADDTPVRGEDVMDVLCRNSGLKLTLLPGAVGLFTKPFLRWGGPLIKGQIENLSKAMARTWPKMIEEFKLEKALNARFDAGWLSYFWADHIYDTSALKRIGWKSAVPNFTEGFQDTIDWYREQRWIPTVEQLEKHAAERRKNG